MGLRGGVMGLYPLGYMGLIAGLLRARAHARRVQCDKQGSSTDDHRSSVVVLCASTVTQ